MRIAVLGSTGYLGKRIVARLIAEGEHGVTAVCRSNSYQECLDTNTADYFHSCNICLSDIDGQLEATFGEGEGEGFDLIINAACSYMKPGNYDEVISANLAFPLHVLGLALQNLRKSALSKDVAVRNLRFINFGSCLPPDVNLYAYTKHELNRFGKMFAQSLDNQPQVSVQSTNTGHPFSYVNLQLEFFYGPDEPSTRFISSCIDKLSRNEPLDLTSGRQHRDIIYIDDVVEGLMTVISATALPRYVDISLGSGQAPSIQQIVTFLRDELQSSSPLNFGAVPSRSYEPDSMADLALFKLLGGSIRYGWQEGLRHVLKLRGLVPDEKLDSVSISNEVLVDTEPTFIGGGVIHYHILRLSNNFYLQPRSQNCFIYLFNKKNLGTQGGCAA